MSAITVLLWPDSLFGKLGKTQKLELEVHALALCDVMRFVYCLLGTPRPSDGPLCVTNTDLEGHAFAGYWWRKRLREPEARHRRQVLDTTYCLSVNAICWI